MSAFRHALTALIGQTLTPELCAYLETVAATAPPRVYAPIDISKFPTVTDDFGVTIGLEHFTNALAHEMHEMHVAHWNETEVYRDEKFNPDYPSLIEDDKAGTLVQVVARDSKGMLVGSFRVYLVFSRHTQKRIAVEDTIYVIPELRKTNTWLASKIVGYTIEAAKQLGATGMNCDAKIANDAGILLRRHRFKAVGTKFYKRF